MSDCIRIDREPHESDRGLVVPDFYIYLNGSWQQMVFDNRHQWLEAAKKVWNSRYSKRGEWTFPGRKRGSPFEIAWQKCRDGTYRLKVRNPEDRKHHWSLVVYESYVEDLPTMEGHAYTKTNSTSDNINGNAGTPPAGAPVEEMTPGVPCPKGECKYGKECRNKYKNVEHGVEYTHGGIQTVTKAHSMKCDAKRCPGRGDPYHEFAYQH